MAHLYTPRDFLRRVPLDLLRDLFEHQKSGIVLDWAVLIDTPATAVETVYAAWDALPATERARVEAVWRRLHDLATADGVRTLAEEAPYFGVDLATDFERLEGHHAKIVWASLHHPDLFRTAAVFQRAEGLSGRYWRKRAGMPSKVPDTSRSALDRLEDAVRQFYLSRQGRGRRCTAETYTRVGGQVYVFVYPDDYAETYVGHDDDGSLVRQPRRQAFEVVFVFDPTTGELELFAQGGKPVTEALVGAFSQAAFGCDPPPEPSRFAYDLDHIADPDCPLPTDPADGITEVRVKYLRAALVGSQRRVLFEGDVDIDSADARLFLREFLVDRPEPPPFHITAAKFQLAFRPAAGERQRTMTFEVSIPNSCSLKGMPDEQRQLGEKCLQLWMVSRAG